jgi:hypothetical protein
MDWDRVLLAQKPDGSGQHLCSSNYILHAASEIMADVRKDSRKAYTAPDSRNFPMTLELVPFGL